MAQVNVTAHVGEATEGPPVVLLSPCPRRSEFRVASVADSERDAMICHQWALVPVDKAMIRKRSCHLVATWKKGTDDSRRGGHRCVVGGLPLTFPVVETAHGEGKGCHLTG